MATIHTSLIRPALISGGNRYLVLTLYLFVFWLLLAFPVTLITVCVSGLLVTIGHGTLIYLSYEDPEWWPILVRHWQQQPVYLAAPPIRKRPHMLFKSYDEPRSFGDLLPYSTMPTPGVILCENLSLVASFAFAGPDLELATDEALQGLAEHLNLSLRGWGKEWTFQTDVFRYPAAPYPGQGSFPDSTSRLMDEERRQQYDEAGKRYESMACLTVTYQPPRDATKKARALFTTGATPHTRPSMNDTVFYFERQLEHFIALLGTRLHIRRLLDDDFLTHLYRCATGLYHRVAVPIPATSLNTYIGNYDMIAGYYPKIDTHHIRTIAITGFPPTSKPAILAFLSSLPCSYRWHSRFICEDPQDSRTFLTSALRNFDANITGPISKIIQGITKEESRYQNLDAKNLADDANIALQELDSGTVRYGRYTSVIVLYHQDEGECIRLAQQVVNELRAHFFPARIEEMNALESFLGSLPGDNSSNVRQPRMHSLNFAELMPATTVWSGLEENPSPYFSVKSPALAHAQTHGQTPFRINLHVQDVGHTLILGPTGNGKTTLLLFLLAQFLRYPKATVHLFDRMYGAELLTRSVGGTHLDLGNDQSVQLCPLAHIDEEQERAWAAEWLESLLILQNITVTIAQRTEIHRALDILATEKVRSMSTFVLTVQDDDIRAGLQAYTAERPYGWLFDGTVDTLPHSHFNTFDITRLLEVGDKVLIPALSCRFHAIERSLDGRPTIIAIDEGWIAFLHSQFAAQFEQWLRTMRVKNCAVVFVTHSLADFAKSQHRELILQMCPTKFFIPDSEARSTHIRKLYEDIGFTEGEIRAVAEGMPKRDYLYTSPEGERIFQLDLGPVALAICGRGGDENRRTWKTLRKVSTDAWVGKWLEHCGAKEGAKIWKEYEQQRFLSQDSSSVS